VKKEKKSNSQKKAEDIARSYSDRPDPLGSYSGVTPEMRCMPRLKVEGKVFMKVDGKPVQDADDL
jgi:hypothetical protein